MFEERMDKSQQLSSFLLRTVHLGIGTVHLPGAAHQVQDLQRISNGCGAPARRYALGRWRGAPVNQVQNSFNRLSKAPNFENTIPSSK